ncbi:MAG: DUF2147 domain-containing protein [Nitrospiraceae bacterium]|nr:DUF2147 domain-containing protein [Nitrospiraceae bacterium]
MKTLDRSFKTGAALCFIFTLFIVHHGLAANGAGPILGTWLTRDRDAKISIYECGGKKYCGKIVWVKDGPKTDEKNPDAALRNRPVLGLEIMKGFSYEGKNRWAGGRLYDPKSGNTYRGVMRFEPPNRLRLRGYVLLPLFGRTDTWTKMEGPDR